MPKYLHFARLFYVNIITRDGVIGLMATKRGNGGGGGYHAYPNGDGRAQFQYRLGESATDRDGVGVGRNYGGTGV